MAKLRELDECPVSDVALWGLNTVLVSAEGGLNLRNEIDHGTFERPLSVQEAALLFYCLARLVVEAAPVWPEE